MYLKISALACALLLGGVGLACDVCGSSSPDSQLGFWPGMNKHFLGFRYKYRLFKSEHPTFFEGEEITFVKNHFHSAELYGRFVANKRLQFYAFAPYMAYRDKDVSISGFGDARAMVNYGVILGQDSLKVRHRLFLGAGIKMPTGKNGQNTSSNASILQNMQPGSGSWDYSANLNYSITLDNWSVGLESSYTLTTPNFWRYKFGNRWVSAFQILRTMENRVGYQLIPSIGLRHERANIDYVNISKNETNPYSGGYFVHTTLGLKARLNNVVLSLDGQLPVAQKIGQGYVTSRLNVSASIQYLF